MMDIDCKVRIKGDKRVFVVEGVNDKRFVDGKYEKVRSIATRDKRGLLWVANVKLDMLELVE
ncbi:MAG: hypothetical protein Q9M19_01225 [Mariprofundaceae bacterium]|nr:hypothetical protein [Mariprofundaceae bacterium]